MKTDIVADPKTVMIELISAPVAPLAVLRVPQDMRVADFTVELKLVLVKNDYFVCFSFVRRLERLPMQSVELSSRVRWVTARDNRCLNDHDQKSWKIENSNRNSD